jgi:hypothetical protein
MFPNGMAYDENRQRFYCSDTFNVAWAWDVGPDQQCLRRRVLLQREDCDGTPAGSTMQIRFGGADRRDYYIDVVPAGSGDSLKNRGAAQKGASTLYRGRGEGAGVAISAAHFHLEQARMVQDMRTACRRAQSVYRPMF